MGCLLSKEHYHHRQAEGGISSDDNDSTNKFTETSIQSKSGRLGIGPISISSNSSSSTEEEVASPHQLVGKLALGIQEISDDESSMEIGSKNDSRQKFLISPDATSSSACNHDIYSMDDVGDESVVDWLAESSGTLFSSTTLGSPLGEEKKQQTYKPKRLEYNQANYADNRQPEHQRINNCGSDPTATIASPTQAVKLKSNDEHVVKDTIHVERRHVPLPNSTPSATKGNWLTNRYCVNDYIVLSEIGKGAHSEVRLCKHKKSNELFAVKIMDRKLLQSKIVDIQKEVTIMKKIRHPNILRLYEVLDDPKVNKVYLITEFAQRGDLMNITKKDSPRSQTSILSDEQLRDITHQVMCGLLYLHENNICHNDMKPSNILVNGEGLVKIADFGISGTGRVRLDSAGTPAFMSPEVVTGEPHDGQLADCYALGATIFCIKLGRPPFIGRGGQKNQKLLDLYNQIKDAPLVFPHPVDNKLRDLISRLMLKDPIRRMRLLDALEHPWIQGDINV